MRRITMLNAQPIADTLSDRFGILFNGQSFDDAEGQHVRLRPAELPRTQGFSLELAVLWRAIEVHILPDPFAATLLKSMEASDPSQRATFAAFFQAALNDGGTTSFRINDQPADPFQPATWPTSWRALTVSMRKSPVVIDAGSPNELNNLVLLWSGRLAGAILALLPLEPIETQAGGEIEGGGKQVMITRYERSTVNRAACIEIHGTSCAICGFNFETTYGPAGSGFIEVHHIDQASTLKPGTVIDPAKDLIPVCSNCHSVLHRTMPPYKPEQLRAIFTQISTDSQPRSSQE
jgi:5-methylcytosine-specific restriction protein A